MKEAPSSGRSGYTRLTLTHTHPRSATLDLVLVVILQDREGELWLFSICSLSLHGTACDVLHLQETTAERPRAGALQAATPAAWRTEVELNEGKGPRSSSPRE